LAAKKPAEPDRGAVSGTVLSYRAVVHIVSYQGAPIRPDHSEHLDRGLADQLWHDPSLRERLDQEARESFGSEFRVRLLDASIGSSVELVFALYALSRVPVAVAVFRERVVHFSQAIREAIHATIDGGPYDVTVDVEQEEVFPEAVQPPPAAWDRASAVLAALAGGIGVLGFVTFVGGAIEFARLRKAGLPARRRWR
jgi:hypothetical protein